MFAVVVTVMSSLMPFQSSKLVQIKTIISAQTIPQIDLAGQHLIPSHT